MTLNVSSASTWKRQPWLLLQVPPHNSHSGMCKGPRVHTEKNMWGEPSTFWFMSYFWYVYCATYLLRLGTLLLWGHHYDKGIIAPELWRQCFLGSATVEKSKVILTPEHLLVASFFSLSGTLIISSLPSTCWNSAIIWLGMCLFSPTKLSIWWILSVWQFISFSSGK